MSREPEDLSQTPHYSPATTDSAAERPTSYYKGPGFESRTEHRPRSVKACKIFLKATKDAGTVF
jgi:hypothetical protein